MRLLHQELLFACQTNYREARRPKPRRPPPGASKGPGGSCVGTGRYLFFLGLGAAGIVTLTVLLVTATALTVASMQGIGNGEAGGTKVAWHAAEPRSWSVVAPFASRYTKVAVLC